MIKVIFNLFLIGIFTSSQLLGNTMESIMNNNPTSVKDFGAVGNGRTDDTQAFKDAIQHCKTNKKNLFVPRGKYLLKPDQQTNLTIKKTTISACIKIENVKDFTFYGENGSELIVYAQRPWNSKLNTVIALDKCESVKIKSLSITGIEATIPKREIVGGIMVQASENITVEDIRIQYMGSGIKLMNTNNSMVKDCVVYDCEDTGLNFFRGCRNCIASFCKIGGCGDGNASIYGKNERCGFVSCIFTGRTKAKQMAVIESSSQCYIRNCTFDGEDNVGANGPIINRSQFCIVSDNIIKDVQYGMVVRDTDIADAPGISSYGNVLSNNSIFYVHQKIKGQKPRGCWIEYSNNTRIESNTFYRVQGPQIEFIDRKEAAKVSVGQNSNTLIKNNSFILKNSHLGKDLRAAYYNFDVPILLWKGSYSLENLNFSDNTIFGNAKGESYLLQLNKASGAIISQNVFQDPNIKRTVPYFIKIGQGKNNSITNNTAGKILIAGENVGLKITNNNLASNTDLIELTAAISNSLITGNTFEGKKVITNFDLVKSSVFQSNFLLSETALGFKQKAGQGVDPKKNMVKDNIKK